MRVMLVRSLIAVAVLLVPQFAPAQTMAPEFRADIEQLLSVTGSADIGVQMALLVTDSMLKQMRASNPNVPPRAVEVVQEVLKDEFTKAMQGPDGMMFQLVDVYARHLTHDDVKGLLAFYSTPLGRKSIAVMPVLTREGMEVGNAWGQRNMPRILEALRTRLQAEGFN